ncbi:NUDIX domain-containing protein [Streptomyces polyrhachis]|uniref:NUDIX domain-containing protein n=1 Tax=Streptomyces polyrhachis TaxID=1282885 RepID=A0ABW2GA82_9ACTN
MATPEYIRELRDAGVGRSLLFLPGVTAVVLDGAGRVLLGQRVDTGRWALVGGIAEPGEQPALTAAREVLEETGVRVVPERVVSVQGMPELEYPNGDRCQFMDITFRCRPVGGEARVNDDESLAVGWFAPDALPKLDEATLRRIEQARGEGPAWFEPAGEFEA